MKVTSFGSTISHSSREGHQRLLKVAFAVIVSALYLTSGQAWSQTCTAPSPTPNIVFILFDDLGWGSLDTDPYGPSTMSTPTLDVWADDAKTFSRFYVNSPVCSPARVSVLTGDYPQRYNVRLPLDNAGANTSEVGIPDYVQTLPEMLNQQGYRTVHIGKWHAGDRSRFGPDEVGYDEWVVRDANRINELGCGNYWDEVLVRHDGTTVHTCPNPLPAPVEDFHCEKGNPAIAAEGCTHFTDWQVDEAIATIEGHVASSNPSPIFLNLWMRAPHSPHVHGAGPGPMTRALSTAPDFWTLQYTSSFDPDNPELPGYAALVSHADARLDDLLNSTGNPALEAFWDNTIVFIFSDNGGRKDHTQKKDPLVPKENEPWVFVPYHPPLDPNGALELGKGSSWEGGSRVPMMVRWPDGNIPSVPGTRETSDFPFASFDLYPTLADILCLDLEDLSVDGQSAKEQLFEPDSATPLERDLPLFWEWEDGRYDFAINDSRWKYLSAFRNRIRYFPNSTSAACTSSNYHHLFDMTTPQCVDPGACEHCDDNLLTSEPEVVERLAGLYRNWRADSTRIDWGLGCTDGATLIGGDGQMLDFGTGSWAELCGPDGPDCESDDPRFNFHDQSFSFGIRVRADAYPATGQTAWIAGREGSWELKLDDSGFVELDLCQHEEPVNTCSTSGQIVSDQALVAGEWTHVAFTIRGSLMYLWIDGVQQQDTVSGSLADIASSKVPLLLGGHDSSLLTSTCSSTPTIEDTFEGVLSHPSLHTAAFDIAEELAELLRAPIDFEVDSIQGGVVQTGDVFEFPTHGMVKLRGACPQTTCLSQYPLFDFGAGSFTFGLGVRPDSAAPAATQRLAAKGGAWKLDLLATGQVQLFLADGANSMTLTSVASLPDDTWSHLAFTIEKNQGTAQTVALWIDGIKAAANPVGSVNKVDTNSNAILIGANFNGSTYVKPFTGTLARIEMDAEAVDAAEMERRGRLEIDWDVESEINDVEYFADKGVLKFDRADPSLAGGLVNLCAPADFGTCEQQHPQFDIGNDGFTFSLDLRPAKAQSSLAKVAGKAKSWGLWLLADNRVRLKICEPTNCATTKTITSSTALPAGKWSNVAFTIEPNAGHQELRLYVDGVNEPDSAVVSEVDNNALKRLTIGAQSSGGGSLASVYKGAIRYLRMYARKIDPADVINDP